MFKWLSNLITYPFYYPARNAPNGGKDIKNFIKNSDKVLLIDNDIIITTLNNLHKINIIERPTKFEPVPIIKEINDVGEKGYKTYFNELKEKKIKLD